MRARLTPTTTQSTLRFSHSRTGGAGLSGPAPRTPTSRRNRGGKGYAVAGRHRDNADAGLATRARRRIGMLYALPTAIYVAVFFVAPLLLVVRMSAGNWTLLGGDKGLNFPKNSPRSASNTLFWPRGRASRSSTRSSSRSC